MNIMKYKGYFAHVEYDEEDHIFVGRLAYIYGYCLIPWSDCL